jgi:hypothetical protein
VNLADDDTCGINEQRRLVQIGGHQQARSGPRRRASFAGGRRPPNDRAARKQQRTPLLSYSLRDSAAPLAAQRPVQQHVVRGSVNKNSYARRSQPRKAALIDGSARVRVS